MFRSMSRLLLASLFVLLILGAGTRDDPSLVYNSETVKLVFDDTYTSQGIVLARIECEVMNETGVIVSTWGLTTGWTMVGPDVQVPIRAQAATLPNGLYQLRLRVMDRNGNFSPWSEIMWANKLWRDIPAPGGCRTVQ